MEASQEINVLCLVKEHFSKATDGDGKLVWDDVKGYGFEDARKAIVEHRREKGERAWRPDPRRIKALASSYFRDRQRERWDSETVIGFLRRNDKTGLLQGLPDAEAIEAHYSSAWEGMTVDDGIGKNVARSYILNGARLAFGEIGMEKSEADRRARQCVGLKEGERIPRRSLFQPEPEKPKTSHEALKELAVAEFREVEKSGEEQHV